MQGSTKTILGLDLGTSSIGWAVIQVDENEEPMGIQGIGVRHFEEVVQPKTKELKNAKRRTARGLRRNIARRRERRDNLLRILQKHGMATEGSLPFGDDNRDVYELRAKAVEGELTLNELGRVLFHINRRRGFKSNRGAALAALRSDPEVMGLIQREEEIRASGKNKSETDEEREEGALLKAISELREDLKGKTLGQYLYQLGQNGDRIRGRHADRAMYEEEFERIWEFQRQFHPTLTHLLEADVYTTIFFQRPLRIQRFSVAKCSLEPTKSCADRAQLVAQRFRIW
jgi:CRISPR-associated endonuclease Csn1